MNPTLSFRIFYLDHEFDRALVGQLAEHALPPIETLGAEPLTGWGTRQHLLDRDITEEKCLLAGYVSASLIRAERKIPEALFRANRRLEEEVEMRARGVDTLPRSLRAEIKERVRAEMLPTMPPSLTGIPVCVDLRNQLLIAQAVTDGKIDTVTAHFREATGVTPRLLTPDGAALRLAGVNVNDLTPATFSNNATLEPEHDIAIGMDFLTWLWFTWESEGGIVQFNGSRYGFMLEGPLTFFREGQGAHEAVLRKGAPLNSGEAYLALHNGKKLSRCKFLMADGDQLWTCTVDHTFAFRSLKLPRTEQTDPIGCFQERMLSVERFLDVYLHLYKQFLEIRSDDGKWADTLCRIREWIQTHVNNL